MQDFVNWLALGSIYALVALGIALIYSIGRIVNFAHGELLTVAGYTIWWALGRELSWPVTGAMAVLGAILLACLMYALVFRPLRGAPPVTLLIASIALSIILQTLLTVFVGAQPKPITYPGWVREVMIFAGTRVAWIDVITVITTGVCLLLLIAFLRRTVLGVAVRAAAEDYVVTRLMGVRAGRTVLVTFALAGVLAGVASVLYLASTGLVHPQTGFTPLVKGFIAAVLGGLGSLGGAVLGAFLLAGIEIAILIFLPPDLRTWSTAIVFGILVAVLLWRPSGLLGRRERLA